MILRTKSGALWNCCRPETQWSICCWVEPTLMSSPLTTTAGPCRGRPLWSNSMKPERDQMPCWCYQHGMACLQRGQRLAHTGSAAGNWPQTSGVECVCVYVCCCVAPVWLSGCSWMLKSAGIRWIQQHDANVDIIFLKRKPKTFWHIWDQKSCQNLIWVSSMFLV